MARKIKNCQVADLRPHPLHRELYGSPTSNTAYADIRLSMRTRGYDERFPLLITEDGRILSGVTRWAAAKAAKLVEVPCEVFVPEDPQAAEDEMELKIVRDNTYRVKSQLMLAREQRKLLDVESRLARRRKGSGSDGGPALAADRVGKTFRESGKTVKRRLKVLEAIEEAEAGGNRRRADTLTTLLEGKNIIKALDIIKGKPATEKKPVKVEVPRTLHDHSTKAYSEFYEACCKATVLGELQVLEATLERMRNDLDTARGRVGGQAKAGD